MNRLDLRPTRRRPLARRRPAAGFTLIELVVVVIVLGVLAAVAVPKFVSMSREARIASLKTFAGALQTAADHVHTLCALTPTCDFGNIHQTLNFGGVVGDVDFGWPNAGDNLNVNEIDIWVIYDGFTPSLPTLENTRFTRSDAPDPSACYVNYEEASFNPARVPTITLVTSGC